MPSSNDFYYKDGKKQINSSKNKANRKTPTK